MRMTEDDRRAAGLSTVDINVPLPNHERMARDWSEPVIRNALPCDSIDERSKSDSGRLACWQYGGAILVISKASLKSAYRFATRFRIYVNANGGRAEHVSALLERGTAWCRENGYRTAVLLCADQPLRESAARRAGFELSGEVPSLCGAEEDRATRVLQWRSIGWIG